MDAFGSLARAFSVSPSGSSQSQTNPHAAEAKVLSICACAGVCCIGITGDAVLFQPTVASLSIPLAEFTDPERAIALIRTKLAEVQP
jgi:hypothetical protein